MYQDVLYQFDQVENIKTQLKTQNWGFFFQQQVTIDSNIIVWWFQMSSNELFQTKRCSCISESVSPFRDLSRQFWCLLYSTKNSILKLSFETQSSCISLGCLFDCCFCLITKLLRGIYMFHICSCNIHSNLNIQKIKI